MRTWNLTSAILPALVVIFTPIAVAQVALRLDSQTGKQGDQTHQYASLQVAELELKDFTFPTLSGGKIKLSEVVKGKRLVLVHYFAAWCHNSSYDLVTINQLYEKYRDLGFTVIGICEYSSKGELKRFLEEQKPAYPICIEGDSKKGDRTGTTHYFYRKKIDDTRLWGTPLNILISSEDVKSEGEIITQRVMIGPGELVKSEIEEVLREKLTAR